MNSERRTPPWWFSVISHLWRGGKVVYKDWIKVTLITRVQVRSYGDIFRLKSLTWHLVLCFPPPQTWNLSNLSHKYIPKFLNFTRDKTRKSRHFWPKFEIAECFTHLFWKNCQFLCNYLLQYKLSPVIFENSNGNLANFADLLIYSWKFYPSPKTSFFTKCLVFVLLSTPIHTIQIPCLSGTAPLPPHETRHCVQCASAASFQESEQIMLYAFLVWWNVLKILKFATSLNQRPFEKRRKIFTHWLPIDVFRNF